MHGQDNRVIRMLFNNLFCPLERELQMRDNPCLHGKRTSRRIKHIIGRIASWIYSAVTWAVHHSRCRWAKFLLKLSRVGRSISYVSESISWLPLHIAMSTFGFLENVHSLQGISPFIVYLHDQQYHQDGHRKINVLLLDVIYNPLKSCEHQILEHCNANTSACPEEQSMRLFLLHSSAW